MSSPPHKSDRLSHANSGSESWWKKGVIYQIYPRSFQDHDGDGVGDLKGIEQRLDYLHALGVTAIWISPFFKSPMKDFGYDIHNHRAVDPLFGTLDDFDSLIEQAHNRGIRILIDLVLSHTSDTHPWFESARQSKTSEWSDCYVWAEPKENGDPPNNWLSIFGGSAWTFEPQRQQYYLHNFLVSQPDLNFHCEAVQKEALSIARWWLERGVDGFRLDTVNFYFHDQQLRDNPLAAHPDDQVVTLDNPYSLQNHIHDKNQPQVCDFLTELGTLLSEFPGSIALGEVGATQERALSLMEQYQQPGRLNLCYTFDLLSPHFSAAHFKRVLARDAAEAASVWRCLAFSNHDVQRSASRFSKHHPNTKTDDIASASMALLLSLRGTPCIYQGEELGLTEADIPFEKLVDPYGISFWPEFKGRDGCRTPMPWNKDLPVAGFTQANQTPWLPIPPEHLSRTANLQQNTPNSLFHQTRSLIASHIKHPAFHSDHLKVLKSPDNLLVFERGEAESRVLCIFNLSNETVSFTRPQEWSKSKLLNQGGTIHSTSEPGVFGYEAWSWELIGPLSTSG